MSKLYLNPNNIVQMRAKAAEIRAIVIACVGFYQTQYEVAKIAPGGARWRELGFHSRNMRPSRYTA